MEIAVQVIEVQLTWNEPLHRRAVVVPVVDHADVAEVTRAVETLYPNVVSLKFIGAALEVTTAA
jgi:hypothetical protein